MKFGDVIRWESKKKNGSTGVFLRKFTRTQHKTGDDYVWQQSREVKDGQFRPLRMPEKT
jgi:hypothetical protein